MDDFKPEKQEPSIDKVDDTLRPDSSDRRSSRTRAPSSQRPKFAVSRQQMMIGVAVVILILLIIAISSALKAPTDYEKQQSQTDERQLDLGNSSQPINQPATTPDNQNAVNLPEINNTPTQAQPYPTDSQGQRIDIPGDINDALNQGSTTQNNLNNAAQQGLNQPQSNLPPVAPNVNTRPVEQPKPIKPTPVKPANTKPVNTTTKPVANNKPVAKPSAGGAIASAPASHYTLQLSGASRSDTLKAFAQKNQLANYQVYETSRNGKVWYVLVYGSYPTVNDAKNAVNSLPADVKAKKPWVRTVQQVRQDMKK